jgi:hypothetical protein
MMNAETITLLISVLGSSVLTALVTLWFTRRKIAAEIEKTNAEANKTNAETASEEVDTTRNMSGLLKEMQSQNVNLYKQNTELEKKNTDQTRTIEIITARLEARDGQLAAANKQLELLRSLAKDATITETLRTQLDGMSQIIAKLQEAQSEAAKMMSEKDKILANMFETNRNLELKKPLKA